MAHAEDKYYVPHDSHWPLTGSIGLFATVAGTAVSLNGGGSGKWVAFLGVAILTWMLFGWFGTVIRESESGVYNEQVDRSFRMGMLWFIFSELMFFAAFFGVLFYTRALSVPWLGGEGTKFFTNFLLWPSYEASWPTNGPSNMGGTFGTMDAWGLPALNTMILLASGATITVAHHAIQAGNRKILMIFLGLTILLGLLFVGMQAEEYIHAYQELGLTLGSGIYGSTFFLLTGFHGLHVTLGATMLIVIWIRCLRGHFSPSHHFAFEGVAWYWHFVDVVWLFLFVFVYWL